MPANALLSRVTVKTPEVLVAAAFLVYAIEHCVPPTALGLLDEWLEHLAAAATLDHQICLIFIQSSLDRPLSGIDLATPERLDKLETRLAELYNNRSDDRQRKNQIRAQIDARRQRLSPEDNNETFHFDHLSDEHIQKIEEAAYQGILRFPPARQFPSLTPLVVKSVNDVVRWDARNADSIDNVKERLAKLCSIARNVGKQRAIDTWRNKANTVTTDCPIDTVFYDSALCCLIKLAQIERIDHQALLLAELAFGPRERGQDPHYRQWFGISPGNFRISLMRARQSFSERLNEEIPLEKPITVERTLQALAPAALLLAQRAINSQTDSWTNHSDKPPSAPSTPNHLDGQHSEESMAPRDLRFDNASALELLLRRAYSPKARLPQALLIAASANLLDERATAFIEKVDYHCLKGLRSAAYRDRKFVLERKPLLGSVIVKLMNEIRSWEIHWQGFAVKLAVALGPTVPDEPPPCVPIRMFFDDEQKEWLEFKIMPSASITMYVDIAFETPPDTIAEIAILSSEGDASPRWLIDADELRNELCSHVIRDIAPGAYQIVGVDKSQKEFRWNITIDGTPAQVQSLGT